MTIGVFLSIQGSYTPEAQEEAQCVVAAVNAGLAAAGLQPIDDPLEPPDVYGPFSGPTCFGRSGLDHHCSEPLISLAGLASPLSHLALLASPWRVVFVPRDFSLPLLAPPPVGSFGSTCGLLRDLVDAARKLNIPLEDGQLADHTARAINDFASLPDDDETLPDEFLEDRTAWLLIFEAARLSMLHDAPVSLNG